MVIGVSNNGTVPPSLPPILKNYTKAAIRTQPGDLIAWSYAYFESLVNGELPPAKEQIEFPLPDTGSGVSPGLLRVLYKKLNHLEAIPISKFEDLCQALGVKEWAIQGALGSAEGAEGAEWDTLFIGLINQETKNPCKQLDYIMQAVSEDLVTKEVSLETVLKYFDLIQNGEKEIYAETKDYLTEVASYQHGNLFPNDLFRPSCPLSNL